MAFSRVLLGSSIFRRSCFNCEVYNELIKPTSDSAEGRRVTHYRSLINPSWGTSEIFLWLSFFFA